MTTTGLIISSAKIIATAEAKLRTENEELVAYGTSTILLMPDVKWTPKRNEVVALPMPIGSVTGRVGVRLGRAATKVRVKHPQ